MPASVTTLIRGLLSNTEYKELVSELSTEYNTAQSSLDVTKVNYPTAQVAKCGNAVYSKSATVLSVRLGFGEGNVEQVFFVTKGSASRLTKCEDDFNVYDYDDAAVLEF